MKKIKAIPNKCFDHCAHVASFYCYKSELLTRFRFAKGFFSGFEVVSWLDMSAQYARLAQRNAKRCGGILVYRDCFLIEAGVGHV